MTLGLNSPSEEAMSEHPDGCMCDECKVERGEIPPPLPKPKRGRPTKTSNSSNKFLTQSVEKPRAPHALYEYERGELRRCHLCSDPGEAMSFTSDEVWFSTLEDRCRHILECHTDESNPIIKRERQRSKEILGIAEIWNTHSYGKAVNFIKGVKTEDPMYEQQSPVKSLFSKKQTPMMKTKSGNWFMNHKLITAVVVIVLLYGLYYLYLLSQGYE